MLHKIYETMGFVLISTLIINSSLMGHSQTSNQPTLIHLSAPLKPPFYHVEGSEVNGLLVAITRCILQDSEYRLKMEIVPVKRILQQIQSQPGTCSLGWFKTKDRLEFARYTKAIWTDQQAFVLTQADKADRIRHKHASFRSLIEDKSFRMLYPQGISYGEKVDQLIEKNDSHIEKVAGNFRQTVRMLSFSRADYTLIHTPEWHYYYQKINQSSEYKAQKKLDIIAFVDLIKPIERHIICHKESSKELVQQLNRLIDKNLSSCSEKVSKENSWLKKLI